MWYSVDNLLSFLGLFCNHICSTNSSIESFDKLEYDHTGQSLHRIAGGNVGLPLDTT